MLSQVILYGILPIGGRGVVIVGVCWMIKTYNRTNKQVQEKLQKLNEGVLRARELKLSLYLIHDFKG